MITGTTRLIAHIGFPTETFKSPQIYNPWFARMGIDAVVVPMGSKPDHFPQFFKQVFGLTNIAGALITMPHKATVMNLVDRLSAQAAIAGACNAVKRDADGQLVGDMFDGEGFVRGVRRKGRDIQGARALVVGSGGVGSAIAASLAQAGVAELALFDSNVANQNALAARLRQHFPALTVKQGERDPDGFDLVVNATPLGMKQNDPLPMDASRIASTAFVGEVVMKTKITPFLAAARERGCSFMVGADMLFEQIPAYLEVFGFPAATAEELRATATIAY